METVRFPPVATEIDSRVSPSLEIAIDAPAPSAAITSARNAGPSHDLPAERWPPPAAAVSAAPREAQAALQAVLLSGLGRRRAAGTRYASASVTGLCPVIGRPRPAERPAARSSRRSASPTAAARRTRTARHGPSRRPERRSPSSASSSWMRASSPIRSAQRSRRRSSRKRSRRYISSASPPRSRSLSSRSRRSARRSRRRVPGGGACRRFCGAAGCGSSSVDGFRRWSSGTRTSRVYWRPRKGYTRPQRGVFRGSGSRAPFRRLTA